jgi:hypothetical protein
MTLRRYNEILFAVAVSAAVIAFIVHLARFGMHGDGTARLGPPGAPAAGPVPVSGGASGRSLALCLPSFAVGTDWQYYPVAAAGAAPSDVRAAPAPWTTNMSEACHLPEGSSQGVFDVVIRNSSTNEQRLLLGHPGQILDMTLPDPACGSGVGSVPCNTIFWLVRDHDSNQDGVIDARDETILYVSDLAARSLARISPNDSSVLDWIWNARSGEVLLQVQLASGGTEVVNARLGPASPGSEVVVPRVMDQLQRAINPQSAPPTEVPGQPATLTTPTPPTTPTTSGGPPASGAP